MGFKKILLLICLFLVSGCFLAVKKTPQAENKSEVPLPEILREKKLAILPLENLTGKPEYDLVAKTVFSLLFSHLKFLNSFPFSFEMAILKNRDTFFRYFGITKPTPFQKKVLVERVLTQKDPWTLRFYPAFDYPGTPPLKEKKSEEKPAVPDFFSIEVLPHSGNIESYLQQKALLLKGHIRSDLILELYIYDPVTDKKIFFWNTLLPLLSFNIFEDEKKIQSLFTENIRTFLQKISGKPFYSVKLETGTEEATLYIDNYFVENPEVLLPEGKHELKAVKVGYRSFQGSFEVTQDAVLQVPLQPEKNDILVQIDTIPQNAPVFINSRFVGLTPLQVEMGEGTHQIRISRAGYEHVNHILKLYEFDKEKKLVIPLEKKREDRKKIKERVNFFKNMAFYTFFPSLAAFIYCQERYEYYQEKVDYYAGLEGTARAEFALTHDIKSLENRWRFFETSYQFFRGSSVFLLITAAILQIVELEMEDVGVGIDRDRNLGIYYRW